MGLFGIFGSKDSSEKKDQKQLPWEPLTQLSQLDELEIQSKSQPVVIFKHSTRCGISRMVLRQFEKNYEIEPTKIRLYYLDLLNNRDVSNEVAIRFQVFHESPQLLIIRNGSTVHHASHYRINAGVIDQYI